MKMKCRVQLYLSAHEQAQHVESLQLSYVACEAGCGPMLIAKSPMERSLSFTRC
jgi:hypothetical protein